MAASVTLTVGCCFFDIKYAFHIEFEIFQQTLLRIRQIVKTLQLFCYENVLIHLPYERVDSDTATFR